MNERTVHAIALRDVLKRKYEQLDFQRDSPIIEMAVLEDGIDRLNREIESLSEVNEQRAELRTLILSLTHTLGATLLNDETDQNKSHAAKAEELMHHLADLRKRLAQI